MDKELENIIKREFGELSGQVISKINGYLNTPEWIYHKKVINAILKLSRGDINKLDKFISMAKSDPRDVIMLADEI